jgi:hypothetical protein
MLNDAITSTRKGRAGRAASTRSLDFSLDAGSRQMRMGRQAQRVVLHGRQSREAHSRTPALPDIWDEL